MTKSVHIQHGCSGPMLLQHKCDGPTADKEEKKTKGVEDGSAFDKVKVHNCFGFSLKISYQLNYNYTNKNHKNKHPCATENS